MCLLEQGFCTDNLGQNRMGLNGIENIIGRKKTALPRM